MKFSPEFLDEIRARLPVSQVAGTKAKLRKEGREWRGLSPFSAEKKRDKTYFGDKAHLAMDAASDLVRQVEMTSANAHDGQTGEALIQGDEQGFFADKAYDRQSLRETLERRGLVDAIAWRVKHPRYPLESWQKVFNAWAASLRSGVERAHAIMKRWYGMRRVRYLGRNACHLQFIAMAMNMKRAPVPMRAA